MDIRLATHNDVPAIVNLLKLSLGESLMPKSEKFWRWKHIENPFGASPVLLATEGNHLVGVRAFMRWEWKHGDKILKAVRAVDTATHPDYQGRGIFSRLTRQLVDFCQEQGIHFIFNTPNAKSKPGYLKMGWYQAGRLPVHLKLVIGPFSERAQKFVRPGWDEVIELSKTMAAYPGLSTCYKPGFIDWRYLNNPNIKYFLTGNEEGIAIYRLKEHRWGREMRVTDLFLPPGKPGKHLSALIMQTARIEHARLITLAGYNQLAWGCVVPAGPVVTIRLLNCKEPITFRNWHPTLGDMEVF
ncbi:MAG: hypothetical protein KatS3mg032_0011 [Cyclobacteriaceae bacterium]|nr:MAG: hypothetical protein KatS3mg032_0011 [Cyclobacteriaceae bacterium]